VHIDEFFFFFLPFSGWVHQNRLSDTEGSSKGMNVMTADSMQF